MSRLSTNSHQEETPCPCISTEFHFMPGTGRAQVRSNLAPLLPLDWSKCRSAFEPCVVCVLSRNAIHFATKAFTQRFSEADGGVAQQAANHI